MRALRLVLAEGHDVVMTMKQLPALGPEFEPFLYALVGDQGDGTPLSVLSTLARMNLDPWREAAAMAALPAEVASQNLASLIVGLPEGGLALHEARTNAARLILLLPGRVKAIGSGNEASRGVGGLSRSWVITYAIIMVLIVCAQTMGAAHLASEPADHAPASGRKTAARSSNAGH